MTRNAAKTAGAAAASKLAEEGYLGPRADLTSRADLGYFTTCHRQEIIFERMKEMVTEYLDLWYV